MGVHGQALYQYNGVDAVSTGPSLVFNLCLEISAHVQGGYAGAPTSTDKGKAHPGSFQTCFRLGHVCR